MHRILNRKLASHLWLLLLIVITFLQSGCSNLSLQQKPQAAPLLGPAHSAFATRRPPPLSVPCDGPGPRGRGW